MTKTYTAFYNLMPKDNIQLLLNIKKEYEYFKEIDGYVLVNE